MWVLDGLVDWLLVECVSGCERMAGVVCGWLLFDGVFDHIGCWLIFVSGMVCNCLIGWPVVLVD